MSEPQQADADDLTPLVGAAPQIDDAELQAFVASADDTIDLHRVAGFEPFDDDEDY